MSQKPSDTQLPKTGQLVLTGYTTAMGLNAFFVTPHAPMPNLIIAPEDRQSVIAYIMSLRRQKPPST